ncbi:hypothetical protein F2Q68_00026883 [Brassica cretica]|uniref:Uncharacterized protein n=1 Tax=Brassica cretica TaxID=69181 RepID=A0A8S9QRN4_BRACR|nr:hypothetical protein F2Q68_00026883 [Brassica cretica]KAF3555716.1 hypothetical protein F2Q69_00016104 [Brassica cretica]
MVASKIFDLRDSSETGDDLAIPDMMFVQGEEPLGMAFDMLMSSIKERDKIALSQKSIAVKGFVLAIHLVVVESVPSLTEVVVEHCSSSESDSDDDADECRQKLGKNTHTQPQTCSPC